MVSRTVIDWSRRVRSRRVRSRLLGAHDLEVAISLSRRGCCTKQHPEAGIVERDDAIEVGQYEGAAVGMDSAQ